MKYNILRTRKGLLREQIKAELESTNPNIDNILEFVDEYEQRNLDVIRLLKRKKQATTKKIAGALKQTINAHGPITIQFVSSATKRIYGGLLEIPKQRFIDKILKFFK